MQANLGTWAEAAEVMNLNCMGRASSGEELGEWADFMLLSRSSRHQVSPYKERLCFIYQTFLEFLLSSKPCARHWEKQEAKRP